MEVLTKELAKATVPAREVCSIYYLNTFRGLISCKTKMIMIWGDPICFPAFTSSRVYLSSSYWLLAPSRLVWLVLHCIVRSYFFSNVTQENKSKCLTFIYKCPLVCFLQEMVRDLEQCFLCLYGHPSKKAKVWNFRFGEFLSTRERFLVLQCGGLLAFNPWHTSWNVNFLPLLGSSLPLSISFRERGAYKSIKNF